MDGETTHRKRISELSNTGTYWPHTTEAAFEHTRLSPCDNMSGFRVRHISSYCCSIIYFP
ncbi:protein of unknown function [Methanoculleus bourgensis]|uniref:Uncharacterized protein n=1 Tax=Methanoculleus bourgensis TaxID=83986 RepID=A0A0X3BPS4_9EURY|nr:protein of unknown function [Methanoculleus bourgensis]